LVDSFSALEIRIVRIGLEAGPLSQWRHAALTEAGFEVVLLETRHGKAALSAMTIKTDRRDASICSSQARGWDPIEGATVPATSLLRSPEDDDSTPDPVPTEDGLRSTPAATVHEGILDPRVVGTRMKVHGFPVTSLLRFI
jgi:hypothetical protein